MPRQARLDSPGIIVRGIEKRDIINDKYDRKRMVSRLGDLAEETKTSVYAWVLMSNHMHILLKSGPAGLYLEMGDGHRKTSNLTLWIKSERGKGSPIKGQVKRKNTSPLKKARFFFLAPNRPTSTALFNPLIHARYF